MSKKEEQILVEGIFSDENIDNINENKEEKVLRGMDYYEKVYLVSLKN